MDQEKKHTTGRQGDQISITEVARITGLSPRALRHYESLGLIAAGRQANGYRFYDETTLIVLQRILVLRELGVGLDQVAKILAQPSEATAALQEHVRALWVAKSRLEKQIAAVERTQAAIERGETIMSADPFDGFNNAKYEAEVTERWGAQAWQRSDRWWKAMSAAERTEWQQRSQQLMADWVAAGVAGEDPAGAVARDLAVRQAEWLRSIPGTPSGPEELPGYLRGLGQMYVADPRFAVNYGGEAGAAFVRDALAVYADWLES